MRNIDFRMYTSIFESVCQMFVKFGLSIDEGSATCGSRVPFLQPGASRSKNIEIRHVIDDLEKSQTHFFLTIQICIRVPGTDDQYL